MANKPGFNAKVQCDECPWRRDVEPGHFPPERYRALASTSQQGFNPIFSCHKTPEGGEQACVGWLLRDGVNNWCARLEASRGSFDLSKLKATGPLYESYVEMARANGVSDAELRELGFDVED